MKFTDRQVRNLKPESKRRIVWGYRGLGLRITPKGSKTWIFGFRKNRKYHMMTLGSYPQVSVAEAHSLHAKALQALEEGANPANSIVAERVQERSARTVTGLALEYIERWAKPRKRSWKEDQRLLERNVLPHIGHLKAQEVEKQHVLAILDRMVDRGAPVSANRTLAVVRKMFNFGMQRDLVPQSPCSQIRPPSPEQQRDRVLSRHELAAFWNNLESCDMTEGTRIALRLVLVTGQRSGEVARAEWKEIDLKQGVWTIPSSKTKNKKTHTVPLSGLAKSLFRRAKILSGTSEFCFPSPSKKMPVAASSLSKALKRNLETIGTEPFVPHDLRRTAASQIAELGTPRIVITKLLNHSDNDITAIYDRHTYEKEKLEALSQWAKTVQGITDDKNPTIARQGTSI